MNTNFDYEKIFVNIVYDILFLSDWLNNTHLYLESIDIGISDLVSSILLKNTYIHGIRKIDKA